MVEGINLRLSLSSDEAVRFADALMFLPEFNALANAIYESLRERKSITSPGWSDKDFEERK